MKLKLNVIALIAAGVLPLGAFAHGPTTTMEKHDITVARIALQNFGVDVTTISDEELVTALKSNLPSEDLIGRASVEQEYKIHLRSTQPCMMHD